MHLHVPEAETIRRAVVRDAVRMGSAAEVERRYRARYLPAQRLYRSEVSPEKLANGLVDNTDPAGPRRPSLAVNAGPGRSSGPLVRS